MGSLEAVCGEDQWDDSAVEGAGCGEGTEMILCYLDDNETNVKHSFYRLAHDLT